MHTDWVALCLMEWLKGYRMLVNILRDWIIPWWIYDSKFSHVWCCTLFVRWKVIWELCCGKCSSQAEFNGKLENTLEKARRKPSIIRLLGSCCKFFETFEFFSSFPSLATFDSEFASRAHEEAEFSFQLFPYKYD